MEEEEEESLLDEARKIHKTLLSWNKMDELSIVVTSSFPSYIYMKYDFTDKKLFREENFEEYMEDMEFIGSLQMFISLANAAIDGWINGDVPMKNKKDMVVYQQEAYGFNAARKAEKEAAEKQKKDFEEYERKRKEEEEEEEKREIGKNQKKFKNQKNVKRKKFIECLACGEDAKQIEKISNKAFCNLKCQIKFYQK